MTLPGFTTPRPPGFTATKEAYAAWLLDQIVSVGEPVDLVGHDWGAILVQRCASVRPDLIRTLAFGSGPLDDAYVWHDVAQLWQTPGVGEQIMAATSAEAMAAALEPQMGAPAAAQTASGFDDTMKACVLDLYRSAVTVGAEWQPALEAVAGRFPTLVMTGRDDAYVGPEIAERTAARLGGRLLVFEGCGHWWPNTRAAESAAAIADLWRSA